MGPSGSSTLSCLERARCSHTRKYSDTAHTHTLVYMQIQHTHNHIWRHSHIWYEATGKSVVTYLHRVGAHRGLCGVLKFCLTSGKGFYFRLLRRWKESTDSTLKQTKCRIFLLFRGAINVMYRFQIQTELQSVVKWVKLLSGLSVLEVKVSGDCWLAGCRQ